MTWDIKSLEKRRKRGDLIQTYKIVHGLESFGSFPSKACNNFCHFVNVKHECLLNRVTDILSVGPQWHLWLTRLENYFLTLNTSPASAKKLNFSYFVSLPWSKGS